MESAGHEVRSLNSGERVFEEIQLYQPHLLLMDVKLGSMDGRVICRNIKENPDNFSMRIILLSGVNNLRDVLTQSGAPDDCITKSYDTDNLLALVEKQLSNTN